MYRHKLLNVYITCMDFHLVEPDELIFGKNKIFRIISSNYSFLFSHFDKPWPEKAKVFWIKSNHKIKFGQI